jgi:archaemetzincin
MEQVWAKESQSDPDRRGLVLSEICSPTIFLFLKYLEKEAAMNIAVSLATVGPVPAELLPWLAKRLEEVFNRPVVVQAMIPLPAAGYDPRRRQYRGDALITALPALVSPTTDRILGLADVDCYVPGLNFIFGLADPEGRAAFIALPRLRPSFYDLPEDQPLFRRRALTEAVHELGHTWGLAHCPDPHCVMHFSNTLHDTDIKGFAFCRRCQDRLEKAGR